MSSPIICDSGTGYIKLGYANENFPRHIYPSIIGRPMLRYGEKIEGITLKEVMIGDEAAPVRSMLELSYPIEEGIVKDWDEMSMIWDYGFKKKLNIDPKQSRILLTEAALNPAKSREKMCEMFFEKFQFDKLQIGVQALMSLFAEGLMTATLVDSGDGVTHCIPIADGQIQKSAIGRINLAGRHVTQYLVKLLLLRGYAFNSSADFELVREIKEKFCFVSSDIDMDRRLSHDTTTFVEEYRLPDKSLIKIERERFEASEILFQPGNAGYSFPGVSELVFNSINSSPIDIRKSLYQSILLSGGTTMFPGFPTRLENDIHSLYKQNILKGNKDTKLKFDIEVIDPPRRKHNVFLGAGVYAKTFDEADNWWITRQDWEESGAAVLKKVQQNVSL